MTCQRDVIAYQGRLPHPIHGNGYLHRTSVVSKCEMNDSGPLSDSDRTRRSGGGHGRLRERPGCLPADAKIFSSSGG
jgi:hypothetical protein